MDAQRSFIRRDVKVIFLVLTLLVALFTSVAIVRSQDCPEPLQLQAIMLFGTRFVLVVPVFAADCPEDPAGPCERPPYVFNEVSQHWDRNLYHFCYSSSAETGGTRIIWDDLGSGCTWAEFQDHLASLGISTDYETSIQQLIDAGYWTEHGARGPVPFPQPACYSLATP